MSPETERTAGLILVLIPTVAYGGASLLSFLSRRAEGYVDNPVRRGLFVAGHAHAGVILLLALVAMLYMDSAELGGWPERVARFAIPAAAVLMPAGMFLSVASPAATKPNRLIYLTYLGGLLLAIGTLTLGLGLLV